MSGYRPSYTIDEDRKMLRHILDNKSYYVLRGNKLWQYMAQEEFINRTWQSLKNRFLKTVVNNLRSPGYKLTEYEIAKLQLALRQTAKASKGEKKRNHSDSGEDDLFDMPSSSSVRQDSS